MYGHADADGHENRHKPNLVYKHHGKSKSEPEKTESVPLYAPGNSGAVLIVAEKATEMACAFQPLVEAGRSDGKANAGQQDKRGGGKHGNRNTNASDGQREKTQRAEKDLFQLQNSAPIQLMLYPMWRKNKRFRSSKRHKGRISSTFSDGSGVKHKVVVSVQRKERIGQILMIGVDGADAAAGFPGGEVKVLANVSYI